MAPSIRTRVGSINIGGDQDSAPTNNRRSRSGSPSEHQHPSPHSTTSATDNQQLMPVADDGLSHHFGELHFLLDLHGQDLQQCVDRLKVHLQSLEVEIRRRFAQVASGEGSRQAVATRVPPGLIVCQNCMTSPASMVYYPCRHLCVCVECDNQISACPICRTIKQLSFMANLPQPDQ